MVGNSLNQIMLFNRCIVEYILFKCWKTIIMKRDSAGKVNNVLKSILKDEGK